MAGLSSSSTLPLLLLLLLLSISISTTAHPSNRSSLLPQTNNSTTKNSTRIPHSAIAAAPAPSPLPSHHHHHRVTRHKIRNWSIGFVVGVLAGTVSGLLMSIIFRLLLNCVRGRYRTRNGTSIFSNIIKRAEDLSFLQKEDLSSLEVIGRGGCGEVYKAELPSNPGKIIAIKKIRKTMDGEPTQEASHQLDKWMKQIKSEIVTVGRIRHRNLLPLLAHVTHPDCHFLVYEFMKNGSLHDALKRPVSASPDPDPSPSPSPSPSPVLDWPARLKVAKGIAAGLEYLHHSHKPHIIHRDLKPANILLDDDLEARIADFGLAKEIPDAQTHMTTSNIAGTVGYIAPEYHQTLKFTSKCDVYSFGVILGVMVMGKFPSDNFFQDTDEMSLVKWLRNVMSAGDASMAMDEGLKGRGFEEQMMLVLRIACFCTADDPKDRPTSRDVRLMLSQIELRFGS